MRMTKEQRRSYVNSRAFELAKSGEYEDYMEVELQVQLEGYPEAHSVLDDHLTRHQLNELCDRARRARGKPLKPHFHA
jgi:hypothetical protein